MKKKGHFCCCRKGFIYVSLNYPKLPSLLLLPYPKSVFLQTINKSVKGQYIRITVIYIY